MNKIGKIVGFLICLMIVCTTFVSATAPIDEKEIEYHEKGLTGCMKCHRNATDGSYPSSETVRDDNYWGKTDGCVDESK